MKVAVIGTGLAGLSCAHEFERLGIQVDIYERKEQVGEKFPHVTAMMRLINRPIKDTLKFAEEHFGISLQPQEMLKTIHMHGPTTSCKVKGDIGYLTLRGQFPNSLETQLASTIKSKIYYESKVNPIELASDYDYVVAATGSPDIPNQLGIWTTLLKTCVHGAVVEGNFKPTDVEMWLDTRFAKSGFAYLTPYDSAKGCLMLIATNITHEETKKYWNKFWSIQNFNYNILEQFELEFTTGFVFPHKVDNIYIIGNAGGFVESFLGFGQFYCIVSGVKAAQCIVEGKDFDKEIQPFYEEIMQFLDLRKSLEGFTNKDFDRLIRVLSIPGINQLIYNTNIDVIKYSSTILGAVSKATLMRLFKTDKVLKW